jgi:hypothetical protein
MLSWGVANPLSDIAMETLDVSHMLLLEVGAGAAVLSGIAVIRRSRLRFSWRWAVLLGLLEPGLTYLFGNIGYASGTVTVGLIIMSAETLILALLARVLLKEIIVRREYVAIVVGFVGAATVGWSGQMDGSTSIAAAFAFLIAATAAAGYALAIRAYTTKYSDVDVFSLTWAQTIVSLSLALLLLPTASAPLMSVLTVDVHTLAALGAGLFGVAIPFWLFAKAAALVPSRHAAIALNIIPVVGISIGALLGRGIPTPVQFLGGSLVILSLMALTQREH